MNVQLQVIIQPKERKSLQQGESKAHQWTITWPNEGQWLNPLMGWGSGADPMSHVKVFICYVLLLLSYS